ncbi:hypothetical protein ACHAPT_002255 [Fusarium lateritium]
MAKYEPKFKSEIQQMMYVGGEPQDASDETIAVVEQIIQDQVVLLLTTANDLAARRGSRYLSNDDLFIQLRHDPGRLGRLLNLLKWKRLRLKARGDDDKDQTDLAMLEDAAEGTLKGPTADDAAKKKRPPILVLPWDIHSYFPRDVLEDVGEDDGALVPEPNHATLERLHRADKMTRGMSAEEYDKWSKCRHASFTWRKAARFREWSGLGVIADHKPNDDCLDILGFLTCEMVQRLTETALAIQDNEMRRQGDGPVVSVSAVRQGLFTSAQTERQAVDVVHIRQAFQVMQMKAQKRRPKLHNGPEKSKLQLI